MNRSEMLARRYVILPSDDTAMQLDAVGGKGASLVTLIKSGFEVPDFCIVGCQAYQDLYSRQSRGALERELSDWLNQYSEETRFAVRSSAQGEDSDEYSFAGLYNTVLGASGITEVIESVQECWDSFHDAAAVDYRELHGLTDSSMAVVVQVLIPAEWSGVAFSANPVNQCLQELVVNAAKGLGDELVSGAVNPEEIVVDRLTSAISSRITPDGMNRLPDTLLKKICDETSNAETHFDFPQDIEWAAVGEKLYILQSRPITTIADVYFSRDLEPWRGDRDAAPDTDERIWSRAYADEIWAPPVSPLFYNIHNLTPSFASYWKWHADKSSLPPDVFKYHRACAYVDVDVLRRQYAYHPAFSRIAGILNFFPVTMQGDIQSDRWLWRGRLIRTLRFEFQERKLRSLAHNHRMLDEMWPEFIERTDKWFELDLESMSIEQITNHLQEVNRVVSVVSPACGFAVAYHAHDLTFVLTGLLEKWFGDGDQFYAKVTSGLAGSATVRESQSLWLLANTLSNCGSELIGEAKVCEFTDFVNAASHNEAGTEFLTRFNDFWLAHRHRGASYKDLVFPRWGDDQTSLLRLVASYTGTETQSPEQLNSDMARLREDTQRELLAKCRGVNAWRKPLLKLLFKYNEIYMSHRDNHRFHFDRVWYQLRRIYRAYGNALVRRGNIHHKDDIFFLGKDEIEDSLSSGSSSQQLETRVIARKKIWNRTLREQPPKFLRGYTPMSDAQRIADEGGHFAIGASPGVITGLARVIYNVDEIPQVQNGEILVTRQTDPAWSTVFPRISGLVLETGGVLAHGASLCREFQLPCVTAVDNATKLISSGDEITVDGTRGRVIITKSGS